MKKDIQTALLAMFLLTLTNAAFGQLLAPKNNKIHLWSDRVRPRN